MGGNSWRAMPATVGHNRLPPFTKKEAALEKQVAENVAGKTHSHDDGQKILYAGLLAGATSGVVTKTCTAPLERIKILSQNNKGANHNLFKIGADTVKQEGMRSLWKGNYVNCLRVIPQYALKFGVNDYVKDLVRDKKNPKAKLSLTQLMLSGSISGFITMVSVHPLQVLRTRQSLPGSEYKGTVSAITKIAQTEGIRGFYVGLPPALLSGTPYVALQMTFHYGVFKPLMPRLGLMVPSRPWRVVCALIGAHNWSRIQVR